MGKPHRRNFNDPGHAHELTFTCYRGFRFLTRDRSRRWLANAIAAARETWRFDLWAYVIMPEHVHMVVHPREAEYDISAIRKAIKAPVGSAAIAWLETNAPEWLPRVTRQRGGRTERIFWQSGGGYDRNIIEPDTLMSMIDYMHANPLRRGLVERAPEREWSSASFLLDGGESPIPVDRIPPEWVP
ncbi:MAG: hypothetical protein HON53_20460 [Planctomycetaceae bacterium]|nr:hypothetical protein [Planctomycetaceae bacterium]MBT6153249.1 hypothetical protein [Planctomycetaceae bacterium]MBT6486906.1 hypothetical protein [Planctomycetaceae bacterium]MBT6494318.1 hypothetical protein [Planctomycetaceae bacterium]